MLDETLKTIKKRFGKGSIMTEGDYKTLDIDSISTGLLSLDLALGIGGIPRGRITEIFGKESSGKSTLSLMAIAELQKKGGTAALIDVEHAFDPEYAKKLGVDMDKLVTSQPNCGEEALEIVEELVKSDEIGLIVVDSVAALVPKREIDGDYGDSHMGLQARMMSQAMRKLTGVVSDKNTAIVFINQVRMKLGIMFGSPETTSGGMALKFYSSVRIELRRGKQIKNGTENIGHVIHIKVIKNKVAPPFKSCEVQMLNDEIGFSISSDLFAMGQKYELITQSGNTWSYKDKKLGVGISNAMENINKEEVKKEVLRLWHSKKNIQKKI